MTGGHLSEPTPPTSPAPDDAETRTFLIADVRGYTVFTQERGDEAAAALAARFAAIAREGVHKHGGEVIELRGDEALAVFVSARKAIRAAVDLQDRFAEETLRDPTLPLPVGIGLDAGEAVRVEGGYRGGALNLAARLCGRASAGQILASQEVTHLARKVDGVRYEPAGELELKGLDQRVRAVRVLSEDHDPATIVAPYAPARPEPSPSPGPRLPRSLVSTRRRLIATLVAVALVAVAVGFGVPRLLGGSVPIGENAVAVLDADGARVLASVELDAMPGAIAFGEGAVWVAKADGTVSRIDPGERRVTETIEGIGKDPAGIVVGGGSVWVASAREGTVVRINPTTNRVVEPIPTGNGPAGVAFGAGSVWVANRLDNTVARIDPGANEVAETFPVGGSPTGIAFGHDAVWVTHETEAIVSRLDHRSGSVTERIPVGNGPGGIVTGEDAVWVANRLDGTVSRIDPETNRVAAAFPVGEGASGIAAGAGGVWVGSDLEGSITRLGSSEPRTFDLDAGIVDVAVGDGSVWVTSRGAPTTHRGGTITLAVSLPFESIDPALDLPMVVATLLGDGLVGYRRVGGVDGATLVPVLAPSIPAPTGGGRVYAFRLRPDVRYSDGTPVVAADFRRAVERVFEMESFYAPGYASIVGADVCLAGAARCDLRRGIRTDDAAGTVTFELKAPSPSFLSQLAFPGAFPVPEGTPARDVGAEAIPGTGPYMVETFEPGKLLELRRNPNFRPWSAYRPDGFADRVVLRMPVAEEDLAGEVLEGRADYIANPPLIPAEDLDRLMAEHPELVHTYARSGTFLFFLNTRLAPFDDVRVRRAVNLAVDRRRVLELFPFPGSSITCQYLPPAFPGYRPYCPYTIEPDAAGTYTGPDVRRADELMKASGARGTPVTVWEFPAFKAIGEYIVGVLDDLGLDARLRIVEDPVEFFGFVADTRNDVQVGGLSYLMSGPFPADMLASVSCDALVRARPDLNQNSAEICDPELEAAIDAARSAQLADPASAGDLWAAADRAAVDLAPWVALITPGWADVVSSRVGNYQAHPVWGLLLDQIWVQ